MDEVNVIIEPVERKPYQTPEIIHELELETRAGSPNSVDPLPGLLPGFDE